MTLTVNSAAGAFCSSSQFTTLFDYRPFAKLASDTDVPLTLAQFLASPILLACLQIAGGKMESAATMGQRYQPSDLTALVTAPTLTNTAWLCIKINAGIAAGEMYDRRFQVMPDEIQKRVDWASEWLAELADGNQIFAFAEAQQAGLPQSYRETNLDVETRNMPSYQARRLFGRRNDRSSGNWGGSW